MTSTRSLGDLFIAAFAVLAMLTFPTSATPTSLTAVMAADDGAFSGLGELAVFMRNVDITENITIPYCQSALLGTYKSPRVPLIVAYTGINAVNAASCTQSLLHWVSGRYTISRVLWSGTSGFSPIAGGFEPKSPGGCDGRTTRAQRHAIGSVCVTASSIDMSCGMCTTTTSNQPNECSVSNCDQQSNVNLFGNCLFRGTSAAESLANEVFSVASGQTTFPTMSSSTKSLSADWWAANEYMTPADRVSPPTVPTILGPRECAEASQNSIDAGANVDVRCRQSLAMLLQNPSLQPSSATCVGAMEAVGLMRVLLQQPKPIPYVVLRGASNWDMYPLTPQPGATTNPTTLWMQNTTYTSASRHSELVKEGYHYAIQTTNTILERYIQLHPTL